MNSFFILFLFFLSKEIIYLLTKMEYDFEGGRNIIARMGIDQGRLKSEVAANINVWKYLIESSLLLGYN